MPTAGRRKDLGKKHVCHACGTRYYDLHRPIPTCPKCGADPREAPQEAPEAHATRSSHVALVPDAEPAAPLDPVIADDEVLDDEEEEDEDDDKAVEVMADADFVPANFGLDEDAPEADTPEDELAEDDPDEFDDEEID